jgi:hypothetical protein
MKRWTKNTMALAIGILAIGGATASVGFLLATFGSHAKVTEAVVNSWYNSSSFKWVNLTTNINRNGINLKPAENVTYLFSTKSNSTADLGMIAEITGLHMNLTAKWKCNNKTIGTKYQVEGNTIKYLLPALSSKSVFLTVSADGDTAPIASTDYTVSFSRNTQEAMYENTCTG